MGFLIGIAAKMFGIDMEKVNGWKTYTGGAIELLSGIAGMAGAAVNVIQELLKLNSAGDYFNWIEAAMRGSDPAVLALGVAFALAGKGLADIGLGHKHDKLLDAIKNTPPILVAPAAIPAPKQGGS